MFPFTIDKLMLDMKYEMDDINKNIVKWKYKFCLDFEHEFNLEVSDYSQGIFDYIFNLFYFKKAFPQDDFNKIVEEFKELDFKQPTHVTQYIRNKYQEFIIQYKKYFMDYFGFKHEDPLYMERKIHDNREEMIKKLVEYC